MDHLCFLFLVFLMLSRLLNAAFWSPAGKGLTVIFLLQSSSFFGQHFFARDYPMGNKLSSYLCKSAVPTT